MKTIRVLSFIFLIAALSVMAVNAFFYPLPTWAIRVDGVVMLICIMGISYTTVKKVLPKN